MSDEVEPYIEVYNGDAFYLNSEKDFDFDIETIAHALSNLCRYGGHSKKFYSVAEHSVLMAAHAFVYYPSLTHLPLHCLMHDAAEAYLADIPRPIKYKKELEFYLKELEVVEKQINKHFGLPEKLDPLVKEFDFRIIKDERVQAMNKSDNIWISDEAEPLNVCLRFWTPEEAKDKFLLWYNNLINKG